jgi:hypothetical protein
MKKITEPLTPSKNINHEKQGSYVKQEIKEPDVGNVFTGFSNVFAIFSGVFSVFFWFFSIEKIALSSIT